METQRAVAAGGEGNAKWTKTKQRVAAKVSYEGVESEKGRTTAVFIP